MFEAVPYQQEMKQVVMTIWMVWEHLCIAGQLWISFSRRRKGHRLHGSFLAF